MNLGNILCNIRRLTVTKGQTTTTQGSLRVPPTWLSLSVPTSILIHTINQLRNCTADLFSFFLFFPLFIHYLLLSLLIASAAVNGFARYCVWEICSVESLCSPFWLSRSFDTDGRL